jgi:acyl phosphate:glycerol-3-phosphate acyltransferase
MPDPARSTSIGAPQFARTRWSLWRSLLAISLAFAGGCLPAARLATYLASPEAKERLATVNPGTSSIYRVLGKKAAMAVFTVDALKGLVPPLLGRAAGADPVAVDALMIAPLAAHITVGGGRGVATLAGSVLAADPPGFAITLPIWVAPTIMRDHGRGVLVACLILPVVRWLLGRGKTRVALGALVPLLLIYGRLRGPGWRSAPWTPRLVWWRVTCDAEPPEDPPAVPDETRGPQAVS